MNKILNIFINPFIISLPIAIAVILLLPSLFNKYKIELKIVQKTGSNQMYFRDLDHDSISEYIYLGYEKENYTLPCLKCFTELTLNRDKILIDQYNFQRNWLPKHNAIFGDFDGDNLDEVYFFEYSSDSLFLKGVDPLGRRKEFVNNYIAKVKFENGIPDFLINDGGFFDLNNDGNKELIFSIRAGHSKEPRAIYSFDIKNKTLNVNDVKYASILHPVIKNNSSKGVIIVTTCSTPENAPGPFEKFYCDSISRLFAFNEKLELLFPPIEQKRRKSSIVSTITNEGPELFIYALFFGETSKDTTWLIKYNEKGNESGRKPLYYRNYRFLNFESDSICELYLYNRVSNEYLKVTPDLRFINKQKNIIIGERIDQLDLNDDGKTELITYRSDVEKIYVYKKEFRHPAVIDFPEVNELDLQVSKCNFTDQKVNLFIQSNGIGRYFFYQKNDLYYFQYPFYIGIYLLISLFLYFLLIIQKQNLRKKFEQEKRMTELELLTIKNQIDPHFTFNAINTLSSIFYKEDKKTAHEFLVDFSSLIRNTLNHSRKIAISLKDEIDFVRNYLKLQQFRYSDKFDFKIIIDNEVNKNTMVPRMIIQTFAENAVKHGLINKEGKGNLTITIQQAPQSGQTNNQLQIEIIDDGIGRDKSKKVQNYKQISTGKGHDIIKQIVEMYNKLNKVKVSYEIIDLDDSTGNITGTQVIILI